ncbi:MAG: CoA transferase, partial [Alphaproteobacteria bacterium]|nr:CoA transferase [Alphaproteobacteria bacterium]
KAVLLSIQNEREWESLCANVLGDAGLARDPRFATGPDRVANRPALDGLIGRVFAQSPRAEVARRLNAAGIAYGQVNTLDDLAKHPQARFVTVDTQAGPVRVLAPPAIVIGAAPTYRPVPRVGAHDASVRAEFGRAQAAE